MTPFEVDTILQAMVVSQRATTVAEDVYGATAAALRRSLHPVQLAVITDPAKRKAALCPRRSGKSWTAMAYAFDVCLRQEYASVVICLLTLKHGKNVYWRAMQKFARTYGLELKWHTHDMTVTFKNGSTIMMIGAESVQEIEKLRGSSFDLAIIDECKSFNPNILEELLIDVIAPTLDDRDGSMLMIGTPGNVLSGPFYWATSPGYEVTDKETGRKRPASRSFQQPEQYWADNTDEVFYWSRHNWTRRDNLALPKLWAQALSTKSMNGWADDHPTWRREYLGEWVPCSGSYVYRYGEVIGKPGGDMVAQWVPNGRGPHGLPEGHDWRFICGLDLGFEDDFAIVVAAYSMTDGNLYHVYDWKANHQDFFQMEREIAAVLKRFGSFDAMVGDTGSGGAKTIIETLNKNYGYFIEAAEKFDYIEILNGEFISGRVKIIPGSGLDMELRTLQWLMEERDDKALLARTGKLKENPSQPNHLCDAMLYLWRYSHHHWSEAARPAVVYGSPEWADEYRAEAMSRMVRTRDEQLRASAWLTGAGYDSN